MDVSKHMSPDAHACVSTHFVCVAMPSIKAIEMADVWCVDAQSCDVEARGFCEGNCILSLSNSEIALKKKIGPVGLKRLILHRVGAPSPPALPMLFSLKKKRARKKHTYRHKRGRPVSVQEASPFLFE